MKILSALVLGSVVLLSHASAGVSDTIEHRQAFAANGAVTLVNTNGSITISTWEKPEIEVLATRKAKSQEALTKIEVEFEATEKNAKIRSVMPKNSNNASVDYVVKVPAGVTFEKIYNTNGNIEAAGISGDLVAHTVNGKVELENVSGAIDVETVNGNIRVEQANKTVHAHTVNGSIHISFTQVAPKSDVKAGSVNGSVTIAVPTDASVTLKATTKNGGVDNNLGLAKAKRSFGGTSFEGKLGEGAATVEVETVNGSVDFKKS
ncbi:MAG: hypothetical protein SFV32_01830 [Opitutaceae bacterium]|nr:hypothetical protein [Opitutaceae bacterium]